MEFSIIVPIYNAERTINRCLDSIKKQSYCDYEVLMIDDGSVDQSADICILYAEKDKRFRYYFQNNAGPSTARNKGLDLAHGSIIVFLDSDDFFENDALVSLYTEFKKEEVDILFHSYNKVDMDGNLIERKSFEINADTVWEMICFLSKQDMFGYTWIKSIRKSVIGDTRFRKDINLFEDEIFICDIINEQTRIGLINQPIINYAVDNTLALTGKIHQDYCIKRDSVFLAWVNMARRFGRSEQDILDIANNALVTCKYYFLERDIDIDNFLVSLKNTSFIQKATVEREFAKLVLSKKKKKLMILRQKYRIKVKIGQLLKGN